MKARAVLAAALLAAGVFVFAPSYAAADDHPMTVVGEIVRYEPGHVIVLRGADNNEVTYTLTPSITIPTGVEVGRRVTLYTTHNDDGSWGVTRVTTSVTPEGNTQKTVERTRMSPSGDTTRTTTTTTIDGTVTAYEPRHSVTISRPDGSHVTYMLNDRSQFPEDLAVGRTIIVTPDMSDTGERVANTITYTETKTETNKHGDTHTKTKTKTKRIGENQ